MTRDGDWSENSFKSAVEEEYRHQDDDCRLNMSREEGEEVHIDRVDNAISTRVVSESELKRSI
jgi:hypothetical protein